MPTHLRSFLAIGLLTLTSAPVFAQASADARNSYDAGIQEAKHNFLKCNAEALAAGVTEDYTGVTPGGVTKGRSGELKGDRDFCAANTVTT